MISFRPLPILSILTVIALAVLITLGRWQWERYELKLALAEEPVAERVIEDYEALPDGIQFVYGVRQDLREQGWRVFAPVQFGDTVVFIDADFIVGARAPDPSEVRFPAALRLGAPVRGASITPEPPAPLTRAPRPLQRLWFAIDLGAMGRNAGLENVADYYIAGDYVGADGRALENPFALAPGADALPPARHMGYAITWFGLAIVLVVIYFAYHTSVGRLSVRGPRQPGR